MRLILLSVLVCSVGCEDVPRDERIPRGFPSYGSAAAAESLPRTVEERDQKYDTYAHNFNTGERYLFDTSEEAFCYIKLFHSGNNDWYETTVDAADNPLCRLVLLRPGESICRCEECKCCDAVAEKPAIHTAFYQINDELIEVAEADTARDDHADWLNRVRKLQSDNAAGISAIPERARLAGEEAYRNRIDFGCASAGQYVVNAPPGDRYAESLADLCAGHWQAPKGVHVTVRYEAEPYCRAYRDPTQGGAHYIWARGPNQEAINLLVLAALDELAGAQKVEPLLGANRGGG